MQLSPKMFFVGYLKLQGSQKFSTFFTVTSKKLRKNLFLAYHWRTSFFPTIIHHPILVLLYNYSWNHFSTKFHIWKFRFYKDSKIASFKNYRKDTESLYHSFMYSLVSLLSSTFPLPAMHSLLVTLYVMESIFFRLVPTGQKQS